MGSRVLYPDEHYRITQAHIKRRAGKGIKMEEKLNKIKEIVDQHFELCNHDYSDEEYRMLYYQIVHQLRRIITEA